MIISKFLFSALTVFGVLSGINAQDTDAPSTGSEVQSHLEAAPPPLDLTSALWIWTGEGPNIPGMRAFRKHLPKGKSKAVCVTFAISCDDAYTVWVNGKYIGNNTWKAGSPSGASWHILDEYSVSLSHTDNVIAVNATNVVSVDGVILTGVVTYEDGSQTAFTTDASWLTAGSATPPKGFQEIGFDDSKWTPAAVIGGIGTAPWAPLSIAPFTGKACGVPDTDHHYPGPGPVLICPVLPPLARRCKEPILGYTHPD
ncbi:hypothetical protein BT96DRAFT_1017771 [Gymnopus androsaceus JB14]|uniref:Bacterial alpha-L-rhamnosidase N-terminal domain-containing protein n=1 Tax=Gymnopus androsaceus JB14 TaxID=1447944 RepID=A0A6A4HVI7_9AGAR|nr:hypothetical protein BT96DRAFT_1017771 [Gymnopus androsaceus JB14]